MEAGTEIIKNRLWNFGRRSRGQAAEWRSNHAHENDMRPVDVLESCNAAGTGVRSTSVGLPRERRRPQRLHPGCIQVVQPIHSRRFPDHDLPPTESPVSQPWMSGRVYDPIPFLRAQHAGGTFLLSRVCGQVESTASKIQE